MIYDERLAKQAFNPDGYIYFRDSYPHSYLDGIAHDNFEAGSAQGRFLAVMIWHQLTEEILRLLYRYSQFVTRLSLYPVKLDEIQVEEKILGELLQIHKSTVVFDKKSAILAAAGKLNSIRQALAHRIMQHYNEEEILEQSYTAQDIFKQVFENWQVAMAWFYKQVDRLKKTDEIVKLLKLYPKT